MSEYCSIVSYTLLFFSLDNFDYLHVPLNLTTVPGSQCTSVLIIPDGLSEGEESFDVVVMRVDNNMILSYATVYISKCFNIHFVNNIYCFFSWQWVIMY